MEHADNYNKAFQHGFNVGVEYGKQEAIREMNEKIW